MTRIVYNADYGGFSISETAWKRICELKGQPFEPGGYYTTIERTDPHLLQVIDEIGLKACNGPHASLAIREIPAGTPYRIDEYDGAEAVMERDEYIWSIA